MPPSIEFTRVFAAEELALAHEHGLREDNEAVSDHQHRENRKDAGLKRCREIKKNEESKRAMN